MVIDPARSRAMGYYRARASAECACVSITYIYRMYSCRTNIDIIGCINSYSLAYNCNANSDTPMHHISVIMVTDFCTTLQKYLERWIIRTLRYVFCCSPSRQNRGPVPRLVQSSEYQNLSSSGAQYTVQE